MTGTITQSLKSSAEGAVCVQKRSESFHRMPDNWRSFQTPSSGSFQTRYCDCFLKLGSGHLQAIPEGLEGGCQWRPCFFLGGGRSAMGFYPPPPPLNAIGSPGVALHTEAGGLFQYPAPALCGTEGPTTLPPMCYAPEAGTSAGARGVAGGTQAGKRPARLGSWRHLLQDAGAVAPCAMARHGQEGFERVRAVCGSPPPPPRAPPAFEARPHALHPTRNGPDCRGSPTRLAATFNVVEGGWEERAALAALPPRPPSPVPHVPLRKCWPPRRQGLCSHFAHM